MPPLRDFCFVGSLAGRRTASVAGRITTAGSLAMPTIMVPLDGSEKDARALAVALALADLAGAGLRLVHVLEGSERNAETTSARKAAEGRLAASADRASIDPSRTMTLAVLESHDVVEQIVTHAAACDAIAVVMGTRAPSSVGRVIVGSVADRVMRECPRPVVLVPPGAGFMAGKHIRIGRVLVPLDGSVLSAKALEFLVDLPRAHELEYVVFGVVPPPEPTSTAAMLSADNLTSRQAAEAETRLEAVAARVRGHGAAAVEVQVAEGTDPAAAIVAAVRDCLVELIAMSTRGTGGLRRLVLGSVAEGVVRASEVPVLLLTPATLAAGNPDTTSGVR